MSFVNPVNNPQFCKELYGQISSLGSHTAWLLVHKEGAGFRIEKKSDYRLQRFYRWLHNVSYDLADNSKILLEQVKAVRDQLDRQSAAKLCLSMTVMLKHAGKKEQKQSFKDEALSIVDSTVDSLLAKDEISMLLNTAIKKRKIDTAKKLILLGPNFEWKTKKEGHSHQHLAIHAGFPELFGLLVEKGKVFHIVDHKQNSPLHAVCQKLQIENALLLVKKGADVTLKNQDGNPPFALPALEDAPQAVRQFYMALFQHNPWAVKMVKASGIDEFLQSIRMAPSEALRNGGATFTLEVAFLFQDDQMAICIAEKLSTKQFSQALQEIKKKYPTSNFDFLYFSQFKLHEKHLQTELPDDTVPAPSRDVSLDLILNLFDTLNPNDEELKAPKQTVRKNLDEFVRRIKTRASLLGAFAEKSQAREAFFKTIENHLKNTLIALQNEATRETKLQFFKELHKAVYLCAGRYFRATHKQFLKVCKGITPSFEMEILLLLRTHRGRLAEHVMDHTDSENVNKYNFFLRLHGKELSLPGATELQKYADQHGGAPILHKKFKVEFCNLYTPRVIQKELLTPEFQESARLRAGLMNWFKEKQPQKWENKNEELATWVYPNNTINQEALSYFLLNMKNPVFSSGLKK